jgi:hypothetical protein
MYCAVDSFLKATAFLKNTHVDIWIVFEVEEVVNFSTFFLALFDKVFSKQK